MAHKKMSLTRINAMMLISGVKPENATIWVN